MLRVTKILSFQYRSIWVQIVQIVISVNSVDLERHTVRKCFLSFVISSRIILYNFRQIWCFIVRLLLHALMPGIRDTIPYRLPLRIALFEPAPFSAWHLYSALPHRGIITIKIQRNEVLVIDMKCSFVVDPQNSSILTNNIYFSTFMDIFSFWKIKLTWLESCKYIGTEINFLFLLLRNCMDSFQLSRFCE